MTFLNANKNFEKFEAQKRFSLLFSTKMLEDVSKKRSGINNAMQRTELAQKVLEIQDISNQINAITIVSPKKQETRLKIEKIAGFALITLGLAGVALLGSETFAAISIVGGAVLGEVIGETLAVYSIFKKEQDKLVMLLVKLTNIERTSMNIA